MRQPCAAQLNARAQRHAAACARTRRGADEQVCAERHQQAEAGAEEDPQHAGAAVSEAQDGARRCKAARPCEAQRLNQRDQDAQQRHRNRRHLRGQAGGDERAAAGRSASSGWHRQHAAPRACCCGWHRQGAGHARSALMHARTRTHTIARARPHLVQQLVAADAQLRLLCARPDLVQCAAQHGDGGDGDAEGVARHLRVAEGCHRDAAQQQPDRAELAARHGLAVRDVLNRHHDGRDHDLADLVEADRVVLRGGTRGTRARASAATLHAPRLLAARTACMWYVQAATTHARAPVLTGC